MAATNVRDTSLLALKEITEKGILKGAFLRVYKALFEQGPMTAHELTEYFNRQGSHAFTTFQPRLNELEEVSAVARGTKRPDRHTGHVAYQWDVTSSIPTRVLRTKGKKKGLKVHAPACVTDCGVRVALVEELVALYEQGGRTPAFYELVVWLDDMVQQ